LQTSLREFIVYSLFMAILICASYFRLNVLLAGFFFGILKHSPHLFRYVSHLPDFLEKVVIAATITSIAALIPLAKMKGLNSTSARFFLHLALSLPAVFLLGRALKYVFGFSEPRLWLINPKVYGFHWLKASGSLPSGHMAVFTALAAVLRRYFPRYRVGYLGFLLGLAFVLMATECHFLGDLVAGAYIGTSVEMLVHNTLATPISAGPPASGVENPS
jgi:hypothetical protein